MGLDSHRGCPFSCETDSDTTAQYIGRRNVRRQLLFLAAGKQQASSRQAAGKLHAPKMQQSCMQHANNTQQAINHSQKITNSKQPHQLSRQKICNFFQKQG